VIIHECIQGTTKWRELRLGVPSASQFHRIITPKGKPSDSIDMYLFELLAERIMGEPADPFSTHWTIRGKEQEVEAVGFYELVNKVETVSVGFMTNDAGTIGASPDRLVGDTGLLEIKVPKPAVHIGYLLEEGAAYAAHRTQCQGQLYISEREWTDLFSYCATLPNAIHRVQRDEPFLKLMDEQLRAFSQRLEALWAKMQADGLISGASANADDASKGRASQAPDLSEIMRQSLIEVQK